MKNKSTVTVLSMIYLTLVLLVLIDMTWLMYLGPTRYKMIISSFTEDSYMLCLIQGCVVYR